MKGRGGLVLFRWARFWGFKMLRIGRLRFSLFLIKQGFGFSVQGHCACLPTSRRAAAAAAMRAFEAS